MSSTTYSPTVSITVRYLGPTDTRGSRFRVFRSDGTYAQDPDRLTVPFNHGLSSSERPVDAVDQYLARKGDGWHGRWVVAGANDREYIAVRVGA